MSRARNKAPFWHGMSMAPTLPLAIPPRNSTRKKAVNAYSGILTNGLTPLFSAVDRAIPYKYDRSIPAKKNRIDLFLLKFSE